MTVAFGSAGTASSGATTTNVAYPASISAGDMLVMLAAWGNETDTPPSTPDGFTAPPNNHYVGGAGAWGADAGPRGASFFYRVASGSESGTVALNDASGGGTGSHVAGVIHRVTKTLGAWAEPVCVGGSDTSSDTGFSVPAGSDPGGLNGDHVLVAGATAPDTGTYSGVTLTWTGTFADNTVSTRSSGAFTSGHDVRLNTYSRDVTGTSSAAPTFAATLSVAGGGSAIVVRLRDLPGAPTGLSATGITQTAATLNWSAVTGATGYDVRLNGGAPTDVGNVTSYEFTGLSSGVTHTLEVRAYSAGGDGAYSSTTATTIPANPSGASATPAETSISLSWSASTGATSYEVRIDGGAASDIGNVLTHDFTGLTASTAYDLEVRAKNATGASGWTLVNSTTLSGGSVGTMGDTLTYSMNRIAGTLVNNVPRFAATRAANIYAGTTGLDLVGALNDAAGNARSACKDLAGVLNQLAGTSGLDAAGAASQINA